MKPPLKKAETQRPCAGTPIASWLSGHFICTSTSAGWVRRYRCEPEPAIAGDDAAAVPVLRRAIHEMPNWAPGLQFLTVALQRLGQTVEARQAASRLMVMTPRINARPEKWVMVEGRARDSFLAAPRDAGVPP